MACYLQKIALRPRLVDKADTSVQLNDQLLAFGTDIFRSATGPIAAAPLVFAGNGWLVKSKVLMPTRVSTRKAKSPSSLGAEWRPPGIGVPISESAARLDERAEYAQKQGVVGLLTVPDFQTSQIGNATGPA